MAAYLMNIEISGAAVSLKLQGTYMVRSVCFFSTCENVDNPITL